MLTCTYNTALTHSRIISHNQSVPCTFFVYCTRGADKSLAQPGRKQARMHVRDARDFSNIETRAVINFFFFEVKRLRIFTPF